jgi:hypothetical protein
LPLVTSSCCSKDPREISEQSDANDGCRVTFPRLPVVSAVKRGLQRLSGRFSG